MRREHTAVKTQILNGLALQHRIPFVAQAPIEGSR